MTYSRALIKLSGEALMGDKPYGIDPEIVQSIAKDVSKVVENGTQIAIVVGGGNIFFKNTNLFTFTSQMKCCSRT